MDQPDTKDAQQHAEAIEREASFAERIMALPSGRGAKRPPIGRPDFRFNAHGCAGRARGR